MANFTPTVLGWVNTIDNQSHLYNNYCDSSNLPCFPGLPALQLALPAVIMNNATVEVYDLQHNLAATYSLGNPVLSLFQIPANDGSGTMLNYIRINEDRDLAEGCYYVCVNAIPQVGETCKVYSNAFKVYKGCMHKIEFWNTCDKDGVLYSDGFFTQCLYLKGDCLPDNVTTYESESEELLNGCFRLDKHNVYESLVLKNHWVLPNMYNAWVWASGHSNIRFIRDDGIVSEMTNIQISDNGNFGNMDRMKSIDIAWQNCFLNPNGCCEDYVGDGLPPINSVQKPGDCDTCTIEALISECTQTSVTFSIVTSLPYNVYHNSGNLFGETSDTFTITGLEEGDSGHVAFQNECGTVIIPYQTYECDIVLNVEVNDIECGQTNGSIKITLFGAVGAYTMTLCDSLGNPLATTNNVNQNWIDESLLIADDYTLKVTDDICTVEHEFTIANVCGCRYETIIETTDCTCDAPGIIDINSVIPKDGANSSYVIEVCDSNNNIVGTSTSPQQFQVTSGNFTVKITSSNCSTSFRVFVQDLCVCEAPTEFEYNSQLNIVQFNNTFPNQYCVEVTPLFGNGDISISETFTPDNNSVVVFGNRKLKCDTLYEMIVESKCSVGQKDKNVFSEPFVFTTAPCPPCGQQSIDIDLEEISTNIEVCGEGVNTGGAGTIEYSNDGSTWGVLKPSFPQYSTGVCSLIMSYGININWYIIPDPTDPNRCCLKFERIGGDYSATPNLLSDIASCNGVIRISYSISGGGTGFLYIHSSDIIASLQAPNILSLSIPREDLDKCTSNDSIDFIKNNESVTPVIFQNLDNVALICCPCHQTFIKLDYLDCPIAVCVVVYDENTFNVIEVGLDANGNVI